MSIDNDLRRLINILPKRIQDMIKNHNHQTQLIEITMDLGKRPEARFTTHSEYLLPSNITWQDLDYSTKLLNNFADDNRTGIEQTLHRVSCIRNQQGLIIGLTCRVGRILFGAANHIRDLVEFDGSLLILGKPGFGKTTLVREITRILANELDKRVVIIDTSNEIAGGSDIPHLSMGRARRIQVSQTDLQYKFMVEAIENHTPQVIVIDEIGTEVEAHSAQTIAERGVQLIGTAHGDKLDNLIKNPILTNLVGGVQNVVIGDEEARRRGTKKTSLERQKSSVFDLAIELNEIFFWTVYEQVEPTIDIILHNFELGLQGRKYLNNQCTRIFLKNYSEFEKDNFKKLTNIKNINLYLAYKNKNINKLLFNQYINNLNKYFLRQKIFIYSIDKKAIENNKYINNYQFTKKLKNSILLIGLATHLKKTSYLLTEAKNLNIPIITTYQSILKIKNFNLILNKLMDNKFLL